MRAGPDAGAQGRAGGSWANGRLRELDLALRGLSAVAKMASHAIFQYNILAIDDTHNSWTNMIVKINIPRLLGSSDDKEKIGPRDKN